MSIFTHALLHLERRRKGLTAFDPKCWRLFELSVDVMLMQTQLL